MSSHKKGADYERQCASALRQAGWSVRHTGKSGDFGADLICRAHKSSLVVQCKCYAKAAGPACVQEAHAARSHYGTTSAAVMCDAGFTAAARTLAASADVRLWSSRSVPNAPKPSRQQAGAPMKMRATQREPTRHYFRPASPSPEHSEEVVPQSPGQPFWRRLLRPFLHS